MSICIGIRCVCCKSYIITIKGSITFIFMSIVRGSDYVIALYSSNFENKIAMIFILIWNIAGNFKFSVPNFIIIFWDYLCEIKYRRRNICSCCINASICLTANYCLCCNCCIYCARSVINAYSS